MRDWRVHYLAMHRILCEALLIVLVSSLWENGATAQSANDTYEECACSCLSQAIPENEEDWEAFLQREIDKIRKELTLDKTRLSSSKRKLISAEDNRISAKSVGFVGVTVLILFCFAILAFDTSHFAQMAQYVRGVVNKNKIA